MIKAPNTRDLQESQAADEVAELIELDPRVREAHGPFEFWYRLTAPPRQALSASFEAREADRQGHLTSTVLTVVAGQLILVAIPSSYFTKDLAILFFVSILLVFIAFALFLNRIGWGPFGRWLAVIAINLSLIMSLATWPGGKLTANALPVFDILIEPILIALALLPPNSVFILAFADIIFILLDFYFQPHAADLAALFAHDPYGTVSRPIYLIVFVVGIGYPVMRSVLRAIALGDRAKEIARVQRHLATREAVVVQEKLVLDQDIQNLVGAMTQIANGNLRTSLPFATSQNLRPITGAVNNLYMRIRRGRQSEYEMEHTRASAAALINAIRASKQRSQLLQIERNGNPVIDAIILELLIDRPTTRPLNPGITQKTDKYRTEEW